MGRGGGHAAARDGAPVAGGNRAVSGSWCGVQEEDVNGQRSTVDGDWLAVDRRPASRVPRPTSHVPRPTTHDPRPVIFPPDSKPQISGALAWPRQHPHRSLPAWISSISTRCSRKKSGPFVTPSGPGWTST